MYRAGGLALVFIFVGLVSMFFGHIFENRLSGWMFGIGALITVACLCLFVFAQLSTPIKEARWTQKERAMAKALEEIAINLTKATGTLQSVAFKNIEQVNRIIRAVKPYWEYLPRDIVVSDVENAAAVIVELNTHIENLISATKLAVIQKDAKKLTTYSEEVKEVTRALRSALGEPAEKSLPDSVSREGAESAGSVAHKDEDGGLESRNHPAPLSLAAVAGHHEIVRILLRDGADPDVRGWEGKTPLILAAEKDYGSIVRLVIISGAEIDAQDDKGMTALMRAARKGYTNIVKTLLVADARLDVNDHKNMTAVDHARTSGRIDVVEILTRQPGN